MKTLHIPIPERFQTAEQITESFLADERGQRLTVVVRWWDPTRRRYLEDTNGKWFIKKLADDGKFYCHDVSTLELKSFIYAFLNDLALDVTSALIDEIEALAKIQIVHNERKNKTGGRMIRRGGRA